MRKYLSILICLLCIFISGCSIKQTANVDVVVTLFPQYDIVRWIAGDNLNVYLVIPPGVDTHSYDPSVDDIISIKKSKLFIYTTPSLEQWATDIKSDGKTLELSSNPNIVLEEVQEKEEHHTHHGEHDHDPHIWTSPIYVKYMVEDICNALIEIDPKNKELYIANKNTYISELDKIINDMKQLSIDAQDTIYYFGTPFAMYYLFKHFDIKFESIYETCATEIEPTINDIIDMHKLINKNDIKYIYIKELVSTSVAERLIKDTNASLQMLHSGHNVSSSDFERGVTLLEIMKNNVEALRKGIK